MSEHHTGALESCGRPRTTAWWPSVRASAPSRIISSTNRKRASNTFSVIIDVPSAIDASAIAIGCKSVGKPGKRQRRNVDGLRALVLGHAEAVVRLGDGGARVVQFVQHHLKVGRVDTRHRDVAPGHRGGDAPGGGNDAVPDHAVLGGVQPRDAGDGHGRRTGTFDLRAHLVQHRAQIDDIGFARRIVNRGDALGHDGGHQDVLGGPHRGKLQLNLRAAQRVCLRDHAAVLDVAVRAQLPQARLMHVQRTRSDRVTTGSATLARLHRPTSGPSTQTEARNCRTAAKSASYFGSSGEVMRATSPSSSTVAPRPRNTSAINGTSRMSGQLVIVLVPSASSVAAISLSTLFLAPPTATSPDNRLPPVTTNRSATRVSLVKRYRLVSQPSQS